MTFFNTLINYGTLRGSLFLPKLMTGVIVSYCTCPDLTTAESIARFLIENQLAACVNILPNVRSIYKWQGQVETAEEMLLIIKSAKTTYNAMESAIQDLHPYEIPEIISVPVEHGLPDYIKWIQTCTATS